MWGEGRMLHSSGLGMGLLASHVISMITQGFGEGLVADLWDGSPSSPLGFLSHISWGVGVTHYCAERMEV